MRTTYAGGTSFSTTYQIANILERFRRRIYGFIEAGFEMSSQDCEFIFCICNSCNNSYFCAR